MLKSEEMPGSGPKVIENPLDKIEEGSSYRSRKLVFTSYDITKPHHDFENEEIDDNQIKFLIYQREKCPKTGKIHFQGFVYFYDKTSIKKAKKYLQIKNGWLQYAFALVKDNVKYCSKIESAIPGSQEVYGTQPQQGKRTDLNELKDSLIAGTKTVDDITLDYPMMYHQYGRTLSRIETIILRKQYRQWMTQGFWYYGPTGVGKSHVAFLGYNPDTHYVVNHGQLSRGFWTGYTGQETIIINEFRGQLKFSELLDLVDQYPITVDIKCGEPVPFLAKNFIITAPKHPDETYSGILENDGNLNQLHRRFKIIHIKTRLDSTLLIGN